ncbi:MULTISPECIES: hypothetical protein [unclassified Streptomyces]|uniref:hypothetical protein n=1 Tax=unclassified Streptomyces TaxID=2593676 RepID=UPI0022580962|nr:MULTISPECIES: hypothetical protein [unclassified Streptomyces]MCX4528015.1 hypothetical protein [Streptomyces sp. NBC_01551]MCX4541370.1 hypothetical protein [Streptomyces sp. NBC_01565]
MTGHQHNDEQARATVAPQAGHTQRVCPACGSSVDTLVRRRKSLGIFVPEWVPGSCRNPDCPAFVAREVG